MKVLIDISKQDYELACKYPDHLFGSYSWAIKKGTVISDDKEVKAILVPEGATKGNMMELTFPELEFEPGEDGASTSFMRMNNNVGYASLFKEWWNSSYQLPLEKEAEDILEERE